MSANKWVTIIIHIKWASIRALCRAFDQVFDSKSWCQYVEPEEDNTTMAEKIPAVLVEGPVYAVWSLLIKIARPASCSTYFNWSVCGTLRLIPWTDARRQWLLVGDVCWHKWIQNSSCLLGLSLSHSEIQTVHTESCSMELICIKSQNCFPLHSALFKLYCNTFCYPAAIFDKHEPFVVF